MPSLATSGIVNAGAIGRRPYRQRRHLPGPVGGRDVPEARGRHSRPKAAGIHRRVLKLDPTRHNSRRELAMVPVDMGTAPSVTCKKRDAKRNYPGPQA